MIAVDTSALFAIYADEPEADRFMEIVATSGGAAIGTPTAFEFQLVVKKRAGLAGIDRAGRLLSFEPFEIVAWTPDLVAVATDALVRFGGAPAKLNFGDCMAYALAKSLNVPLLFKGGDFAATDVRAAV